MSALYTYDEGAIVALINEIYPSLRVRWAKALPTAHIQRLYHIYRNTDNAPPLMVILPPPPEVRPLRCERDCVTAEATLLRWMNSNSSAGRHYLPTIYSFLPANVMDGRAAILLTMPVHGYTLAELEDDDVLSEYDDYPLDWQAGQLLRRIALHVSPSRKFGYIVDVLRETDAAQQQHLRPAVHPTELGFDTWSGAFGLMLESVLQDLEDHTVLVAYDRVRQHFRRFRPLLDRVTRPSLTSINAGEMANLVLEPDYNGQTGLNCRYRVAGLRDWSSCVFGDPLLSTKFTTAGPESEEFIRGVETCLEDDEDDEDDGDPIVEDPAGVPARRALYECYHSLVGIARQYHRPRRAGRLGEDMEMHWRRKQLDAMEKLNSFDDDGILRS
ncbi:hypothetical protein GMORB2_1965 [Geosmithia morbida]|uniref:Aminoglycoside phosphotransferase domain-containing protein n=1 Tax=Geosmithia morbida TaxID=1094350 RepID=A0A9P4YS80_9HYPO|nr:uncharacterized protein GMORB2_1965 [Geosmithia morbida]KAF4121557.1 hypothetical protein GMORB2_1965 [Geosmithia morbida]